MGGCISQPSDYACMEEACQSYPTKRGSCPFCKEHEEPDTQFQLVILGPGYTGKTTLRQHLVQRYGHAFYHGDLLMYRDILQHNVLDLFRDLLCDPSMQICDARAYTKNVVCPPTTDDAGVATESSAATTTDGTASNESDERTNDNNNQTPRGHPTAPPSKPPPPPPTTTPTTTPYYLQTLLAKLEEQDLKYGRDNAKFLLENCESILESDYSPKFSDLLHCHVRSTGLMFENHVLCKDLPLKKRGGSGGAAGRLRTSDGGADDMSTSSSSSSSSSSSADSSSTDNSCVFRVVDVGGHRNERKKWNYVLEQPNDVIVFVVSATSFCQVLFEDFRTNSLRESLVVWDNLLDSPYVSSANSELILVLNKIDLFYERHHLLPEYFPEYVDDPKDFDACLNYVKGLFVDIAKKHGETIHFVTTQLTDQHEIDAFDMDTMRENIRKSQFGYDLPSELVNMIIEFTVGDSVFWSSDWLQHMWDKKYPAPYPIEPEPIPVTTTDEEEDDLGEGGSGAKRRWSSYDFGANNIKKKRRLGRRRRHRRRGRHERIELNSDSDDDSTKIVDEAKGGATAPSGRRWLKRLSSLSLSSSSGSVSTPRDAGASSDVILSSQKSESDFMSAPFLTKRDESSSSLLSSSSSSSRSGRFRSFSAFFGKFRLKRSLSIGSSSEYLDEDDVGEIENENDDDVDEDDEDTAEGDVEDDLEICVTEKYDDNGTLCLVSESSMSSSF